MNVEMIKSLIGLVRQAAATAVLASPNKIDDFIWGYFADKFFEPAFIDQLADQLKGQIVVQGILTLEQVKSLLEIVGAGVDSIVAISPTKWDNMIWPLLRKVVVSDSTANSLLALLDKITPGA